VVTLGRSEIYLWDISSQFGYEQLAVHSEMEILLLAFKNPPIGDLEKARSISLSNEPGPHPVVMEGEPLGQAPEGSPRQQGSLPAKLTHNSPRFDVKDLTTLAPDRKNSFLTCSFRSYSETS
jgi:hypothetical protein